MGVVNAVWLEKSFDLQQKNEPMPSVISNCAETLDSKTPDDLKGRDKDRTESELCMDFDSSSEPFGSKNSTSLDDAVSPDDTSSYDESDLDSSFPELSDSCDSSRKSSTGDPKSDNNLRHNLQKAMAKNTFAQKTVLDIIESDDCEENSDTDDESTKARKGISGSESSSRRSSLASCPRSRKSPSVGSVVSTTSQSSESKLSRRHSEPQGRLSANLPSFTLGKSSVTLSGVVSLNHAKRRLIELAQHVVSEEHSPTLSEAGAANYEPEKALPSNPSASMRRVSRCDSHGVTLEPLNFDVGTVKSPEVRKERRKSELGTLSGANLTLTKRNDVHSHSRMNEETASSMFRLFSRVNSSRSTGGHSVPEPRSPTPFSSRSSTPFSECRTTEVVEGRQLSRLSVSSLDFSFNRITSLSGITGADDGLKEKLRNITHLKTGCQIFPENCSMG